MHNESSLPADERQLDRDLALWLRRVEAPHDFTAKVLNEIENTRAPRQNLSRKPGNGVDRQKRQTSSAGLTPVYFTSGRLSVLNRRPALAAAVLLILLLPFGERWHRQRQQVQAEVAAQQFALAMRLTQEALRQALQDAGQPEATHRHSRATQ